MPGWYYVDAAALAGEPSDLHFELETPEPGVVIETVKPKPEKTAAAGAGRGEEQQDRQRDRKPADGRQRQGSGGQT